MHWPYWNNFKRVIVYSSDSWEEAGGCTIPTAGRWLPSETQKCLGMGKGMQRAAPSLFMENWSCFTWWDGWISAAFPVPCAWWPPVRSPDEPFALFPVSTVLSHRLNDIQKEMGVSVKKKKKGRGRREKQFSYQTVPVFHFTSPVPLTIKFKPFKEL